MRNYKMAKRSAKRNYKMARMTATVPLSCFQIDEGGWGVYDDAWAAYGCDGDSRLRALGVMQRATESPAEAAGVRRGSKEISPMPNGVCPL